MPLKRKCIFLIKSKDVKKAIYLDSENRNEILAYLRKDERHKNKFRYISTIILEGLKVPKVYDKEDINSRCKDVTAMKFFKGQENDRIYCKELTTATGTFIVIAAILYERKKSQRNSAKEISLIEKVGGYEYEI